MDSPIINKYQDHPQFFFEGTLMTYSRIQFPFSQKQILSAINEKIC